MDTASRLAVENIPSLLENPKFYYTVRKSPPTVSDLNGQVKSRHILFVQNKF
jgi:hypothetical protein